MNKLIDRDYIAQELYGGLALPKTIMLNNAYVDYSALWKPLVSSSSSMPMTLRKPRPSSPASLWMQVPRLVDGIWHWDGEPIEILILARSEERAQTGW